MTTGNPSYADLLAAVRPRSIHSEQDAQFVQQEIDRLVDLRGRTAAEEDLLSLLGDLLLGPAKELLPGLAGGQQSRSRPGTGE